MHPGLEPELDEALPPEGLDPLDAEASVLDEILEFASGRQAEGLRDRYAPKASAPSESESAIPGVEAEEVDPSSAEGGDPGGEITPEQIALLEQLLSQSA